MRMDRPRVLVIDDDEAIRELLALVLDEEGYAVQTAGDGRAALALLQDWQADLIVLDLLMPGMDGAAFLAELRPEPGRERPVLLLSAAQGAGEAAWRLGVAGAFAKPFDLDELLLSIDRLVRRERSWSSLIASGLNDAAAGIAPAGTVAGALNVVP